jgi:hypothetical protein
MRVRSRLVLGLCGLALSAPAATPASAAPQDGQPAGPAAVSPSAGAPVINLQPSAEMNPSPGAMPPTMAGPAVSPSAAGPATAASPPGMGAHQHHGLFGWRHCVECQRARARSADGVIVPPPPGYPGAQAPTVTLAPGETLVSGPVVVSERVVSMGDAHATGYAVVGGQESAPGYAVANGSAQGAEPAPIGMARGAQGMPVDPRMAGAMPRPGGPGAGPYDPSVMQSSIPPAPAAMSGPGHDRPHIISHIFGLPKLGKLHEEREGKRRDQHAAIAYGDPNQKVNELPASVVYRQK